MDRGCGENGAETGWPDERDVFTYSGEPLEILFQLTGALDSPQEVGLLLLENGVYGLLGSCFYLMDGWESLLKYDFSDPLILLLMILGIAASFTREKETGMAMLLASSKRGGRNFQKRKLKLYNYRVDRSPGGK